MDKSEITILGIDPGIERVGIAVIIKTPNEVPRERVIFSECFKTPKNLPQAQRLSLIYNHILEIISEFSPDIAIVEKIFFTINQKTAIIVAEARGVILAALGKTSIEVMELSPTEIKSSITGSGSAKKEDIARMLPKIISLDPKITQDDELDAIAGALAASSKIRYSQIL